MEIVAYLEVAQEHENVDLGVEHGTFAGSKISGQAIVAALGVATTAWAGGLLTAAPALAYGSGCCRPIHRPISVRPCCRPQPIVVRPCCRPAPIYYQPISSGCSSSCHSKPEYYSHDYQYDQYDKHDYYEDDYSHDYDEVSYHPIEDSNLLKVGSSGEFVALLQQTLADLGYPVSVDGVFGHETKAAVLAYQADQGLIVDGVAGGQTLDSLGLAGAGA